MRPLNVSNVDNRLLASAARIAWEPLLEEWVSPNQRGFLKGRQMLHNLIEVDWGAMTVSLKRDNGALILFDFKAAFPSVSHDFLIKCLKYLGLPKCAMRFIKCMYHNNRCYIRIQGGDFPGFNIIGGVRQGCPLSPLLFAVCVDILLRMIGREVPSCTHKAFADDIAAVIEDLGRDGPLLATLFQQFAGISNLHLNIGKTICIPLWVGGLTEAKEVIQSKIRLWSQVGVADRGVYLGFVIGPGKGDHSWSKPLEKFKSRVARWSKVGGGKQFATISYNMFAVSTLLYVAQLEDIPVDVLREERVQITKMYKGPGKWIQVEDLWFLRENFGHAKSAQSIALMAQAAKLRVAALGCHLGRKFVSANALRRRGEDNIFSRHFALLKAVEDCDSINRIYLWSSWYKRNYCSVLVQNLRVLKGQDITCERIYDSIMNHSGPMTNQDLPKIKKSFQKTALGMIKARAAPDRVERVRANLQRWSKDEGISLTGPIAHCASSTARTLLQLAKLVTPRVHSAVFNTVWNGWCTHRRWQRRRAPTNRCMFKCSSTAEDSIEHYCNCEVVKQVGRKLLRIEYPQELAFDVWLMSSEWLRNEDVLRRIGILIYGVYNAFNTIRCSQISDAKQAGLCIIQHCKQGALGHPPSLKMLDSCWHSPMKYLC